MGQQSNVKEVRNQIRQIVKELFPEIFTREVQGEMLKELSPLVNQGLEKIGTQIKTYRELSEVKENQLLATASKQLDEMNLIMLSWQDLMAEKLGVDTLGEEFKKQLDDKKEAISKALQAQSNS